MAVRLGLRMLQASFLLTLTLVKVVEADQLSGVRFLVSVNVTDPDDFQHGCLATVATPLIHPGLPLNESRVLHVGQCDQGPLQYAVKSPGINNSKYTISLVYHSKVIEDAGPPTCTISWNGTYLVPGSPVNMKPDLLPSCFTQDSREGWHLTYYWFHILDWQ